MFWLQIRVKQVVGTYVYDCIRNPLPYTSLYHFIPFQFQLFKEMQHRGLFDVLGLFVAFLLGKNNTGLCSNSRSHW